MPIQWLKISSDLGFANELHMWRMLYQRYSIPQLATRFGVSTNTIRAQLHRHDIVMRGQGGANNTKITLDEEMMEGIKNRGVLCVAKERSLDPTTIYKALRKAGYKIKELRAPVEQAASLASPPVDKDPDRGSHPSPTASQDAVTQDAAAISSPSEGPETPASPRRSLDSTSDPGRRQHGD